LWPLRDHRVQSGADVAHFADDGAVVGPDRDVTGSAAVPYGIGEQLVDSHHEVRQPIAGQARLARPGRDGVPQLGDPAAVERLGDQ
jgi:hypothetical protein